MAIGERDPYTGHMTTGHEWNGITELNTRVPRAVYFFLAAAVIFSIIFWLLMPAWPLGVTYTKGLLGIDQRTTVEKSLEAASAERAVWITKIVDGDFKTIQADASLMRAVRGTGRTLFGDNCAACHGTKAQGGKGYPDLTDKAWLWGGDPQTVMETLRVGINSGHAESRVSQMPAFGRDQMLDRGAILNVMGYVRSLAQPPSSDQPSQALLSGKETFVTSCASCHGETGKGMTETGAPNLTDGFWIYGGDDQSIYTTIFDGRQGQMPHWDTRLTPAERKILTLYILDLASEKP